MNKILLVAHDTASTVAFNKLWFHLRKHDFEVESVLLNAGKVPLPSENELDRKIKWADITCIGMSAPEKNAFVELEAAQMCSWQDRKFGFYADTHSAWTRPHFSKFRERANFLFVVNDAEVVAAKELWPTTKIVNTGNPLWGEYFKPVERNMKREVLMLASEDTFVILCPGTKNAMHNMIVWSATIQAAAGIEDAFVILTLHPGDKTPRDAYDSLVNFGKGIGVRVDIPPTEYKTDAFVPGADVVINGTSVRVHAIARRIPVIDYYEPLSQAWLKKDTGSDHSYFASTGAVHSVYGKNWEELKAELLHVQNDPDALVYAQAAAVEAVEENDVLERMRVALENI